jgi:UDPglucose 6-dehydrogenase
LMLKRNREHPPENESILVPTINQREPVVSSSAQTSKPRPLGPIAVRKAQLNKARVHNPTNDIRIVIVGLGYVGLSTAACLASKFHVTGVDYDPAKVALIEHGTAPFKEELLPSLLQKHVRTGMLKCTTSYDVVSDADIVFIAVGTPSTSSGEIDLSQVRSAAQSIGRAIAKSTRHPTVLVKSTVIPGTSTSVVVPVIERYSGKTCGDGFGVCSNPEFLREGQAVKDTLKPNRIVIGPVDQLSRSEVLRFYGKFYGKQMPPVVETAPETAEMIKYASNAFLATKISFINLIARLCEKIPGSDVNDVARGMGLDPRIGSLFLQAGPGFGGSCFPKDVQALVRYANNMGLDASLLESTLAINETQPDHVAAQAEKMLGGVKGKNIAVLGLAFNPDTDDVRESRAIPLIRKLVDKGARVGAYDPMAMEGARRELGPIINFSTSAQECVKGADLVIIMTAWNEFKGLNSRDFSKLMGKEPRVLDARRIYDPAKFSNAVFAGTGLGTSA